MKIFNIKTPSNLYMLWNFGSLIFLLVLIQFFVGLMLSMHYFNNLNFFISSFNIYYNLNYGWVIRMLHSNLTSIIFLLIIIHLVRNIFYMTLVNKLMWLTGIILLFFFMIISFLGYSLIWNQMSYWAMMVITNFFSSIPWVGMLLIKWIWGGFNINFILINRFFSFHFLFPMFVIMMSMIHLLILHMNKSTNPLGINNKLDQMNLNPMNLFKDFYFLMLLLLFLFDLILINSNYFNNTDSFNMMDYFKTPNHIEPEWYFLFFYSILRSIENKFSGMLIMIFSIIMIILLPFILKINFQSMKFNWKIKMLLILLINFIFVISYFGMKIIEYPYNLINIIMILNYFLIYFFIYVINKLNL